MSKIFDKLEENISKNKDEEKRKEEKRNKLWNKYYAEEEKIQKELKIQLIHITISIMCCQVEIL